eukprot:Gb_18816 [translate_table: standard]
MCYLLRKAGHVVSATDLAGAGINPLDIDEIRTLNEYHRPLMEFLSALSRHEKVILVGHSMGGVDLSCAMEEFPHKIEFAFEKRIGSWEDNEFNYARGQQNPPTSLKFGKRISRQRLYQRSPSPDITLAEMLLRKYPMWEGAVLHTKEKYGSARRAYIVTTEDMLIWEDLQRKMIAENQPDRVYEMEGSDHTPFFSSPARLAQILIDIADIC